MTEHGLQANFRALCVWLFHESNRLIPKKNREIKISMSIIVFSTYNALKLEKSAISKVQKQIFCNFKNGKKTIFAQEKSLKLPKMQFSDFFLVQKWIFCHF